MDLRNAPDRADLMSAAFTYQRGVNEGEYLREINPKFQAERKAMNKAIEAARK